MLLKETDHFGKRRNRKPRAGAGCSTEFRSRSPTGRPYAIRWTGEDSKLALDGVIPRLLDPRSGRHA